MKKATTWQKRKNSSKVRYREVILQPDETNAIKRLRFATVDILNASLKTGSITSATKPSG